MRHWAGLRLMRVRLLQAQRVRRAAHWGRLQVLRVLLRVLW